MDRRNVHGEFGSVLDLGIGASHSHSVSVVSSRWTGDNLQKLQRIGGRSLSVQADPDRIDRVDADQHFPSFPWSAFLIDVDAASKRVTDASQTS